MASEIVSMLVLHLTIQQKKMWHNDRKEMVNYKAGEYMIKICFLVRRDTGGSELEKFEYSLQFLGLNAVGRLGIIRNFSRKPPVL